MLRTLFDEAATYVGFTSSDVSVLRELAGVVRPAFPRIVDRFYEAIAQEPRAAQVFTGGAAQMDRQKQSLREWLEEVVSGSYDAAYVERHARVGRVHVRIGLDQRYMLTGMCLIREGLHAALDDSDWPGDKRLPGHSAINKICDIELAIMLETYREDSVQRIRRSQQLATLGQLAASIGHELRNPLAVIESSVHLLKRSATDERAQKHLGRIGANVKSAGDIIGQLLELARDREPQRSPTDVAELVRDAVRGTIVPDGVGISVAAPVDLPLLRVDGVQLKMVLTNLLTNATQAVVSHEGAGEVSVQVGLDARELWLVVEDDGPGLSAEALARAFEPLFTTRAKGIGLGLALCRRIAERHGGSIRVANREEGGARFELRLPDVLADLAVGA